MHQAKLFGFINPIELLKANLTHFEDERATSPEIIEKVLHVFITYLTLHGANIQRFEKFSIVRKLYDFCEKLMFDSSILKLNVCFITRLAYASTKHKDLVLDSMADFSIGHLRQLAANG